MELCGPDNFPLWNLGRKRDRAVSSSVPIPKFLCTFYVCVECAAAEAFDGCEDVIGGFCPAERLGRGISDFDISGNRGFQFGYGSMRAALAARTRARRSARPD